MARSTFEKYGGFAVISRVVAAFYDKVLDSPLLSPFFEGTDMKRQIDHQTKFIASLMGGPVSYSNEELERVHSRFRINQAAFDEVAMLLRETLEDFDMESEDVTLVTQNVINRSKFIVNTK